MVEELLVTPAPAGRPAPAVDVPGLVDDVLADFLDRSAATLTAWDPGLARLAGAARDAVRSGGKRIRPTFAYWGWRGVARAGTPVDAVLPALAALELLHAFALVHDDVMDGSSTRRGRPTTHRAFARAHAEEGLRGDPFRYGEGAAILVGDLCLVWADQLIAASGLPGHRTAAARACYDQMRLEAIAGQFLDLLGGASRTWTVDRALLTIRLKTASYTAVRPLHFGAALAGAGLGGAPHRAYTRYGLAVGEAFQLRDDLLGLDGDPAVTGKPVGDDTDAQKPTVLLQYARALATDAQAAELENLLRHDDLSPGEATDRVAHRRRLADLVRRTGAAERVEKLIEERVATGLAALDGAPIAPEARAALADLARAAAWRTA